MGVWDPQTAAPPVEMPFSRLACVAWAADYLEGAHFGTSRRLQPEQASSMNLDERLEICLHKQAPKAITKPKKTPKYRLWWQNPK